ncbi:hypothetical protein PILCRDRAFT_815746 [Piloderma croceum F 1598]|uniref:2,4-dienoyl-CoA reductase [(3E)-enoyl-CoA-producing] n=1 Tax=Piloderma croceum (strain F 1598) TaxID=765440 RepID=A0A0C3G761_PILCF|nr:hypothetical protein PILCRDRAFT_815746 [Piloderma croceum F 1598]
MPGPPFITPVVDSTSIFLPNLFRNRVVFVTGGGSGICREMTEAVMCHGANATIVGRKLDRITQTARELSEATGQTCIAVQADVRQPKQVQDAVAKTIAKFGRLDFVICGAAGNFLATIDGMSENAFRTVMEIDTLGTFHTIKATLPHVRASKGSYIHVSALLHYKGTPYQAHVSAAKAAVDALSRVLAVEEGPMGVRSNVIAPGPIGGTEGISRLANQTQSERNSSAYPIGRIGHVKDIANAAVFLFSEAAANITGQILPVDGGHGHMAAFQLPYPQSILDPDSVKHMIKSRL